MLEVISLETSQLNRSSRLQLAELNCNCFEVKIKYIELKWKPGLLVQSSQQDEGYGCSQQCVTPKAPVGDDHGKRQYLNTCQTKLSLGWPGHFQNNIHPDIVCI